MVTPELWLWAVGSFTLSPLLVSAFVGKRPWGVASIGDGTGVDQQSWAFPRDVCTFVPGRGPGLLIPGLMTFHDLSTAFETCDHYPCHHVLN